MSPVCLVISPALPLQKAAVRPCLGYRHIPVPHRVIVNIVHVTVEVALIANNVIPESLLPHRRCAIGVRCRPIDARENRLQRVHYGSHRFRFNSLDYHVKMVRQECVCFHLERMKDFGVAQRIQKQFDRKWIVENREAVCRDLRDEHRCTIGVVAVNWHCGFMPVDFNRGAGKPPATQLAQFTALQEKPAHPETAWGPRQCRQCAAPSAGARRCSGRCCRQGQSRRPR